MRRVRIDRRGFVAGAFALAAGCSDTVEPGKEEHDPLDELAAAGEVPDILRIGITPSTGQDTSQRLAPLIRYLGKSLGVTAVGITANDYDHLAALVQRREIEVGVFSPLAYVQAKGGDAVAIATATRSGTPTYLGYLAIKGESPPPLEALRGRSIGWVNKSSTSGYLYPRAMLLQKGYDPDSFFGAQRELGDHAAVIAAVLAGEVEVGAVASSFVDGDSGSVHPEASSLAVVAKTQRIPFDCVVVHKRIRRKLAKRLRAALLELVHDAEASHKLYRTWGLDGFVKPLGDRYAEIERIRDAMRKRG